MKEKIKVTIEVVDAFKASNLPINVFTSIDFNHKFNPDKILGDVDCYLEDGSIKGEFNFYSHLKENDIEKLKELVPAMSGRVVERNEKDEITRFELTSIGLCNNNADPNIKSIKEQLLR